MYLSIIKKYILFTTIIILIYSLFAPKLSSFLYPIKRHSILDNFLKNTSINHTIDAKLFWQLRDNYYPGYIDIDKNGLHPLNEFPLVKNVPIEIGKNLIPIIHFSSRLISSYEVLLEKSKTKALLLKNNDDWITILHNNNEIILTKDKYIVIVFIKSISEMSKANGLYEYKDRDKKLLANKNWYVITVIER